MSVVGLEASADSLRDHQGRYVSKYPDRLARHKRIKARYDELCLVYEVGPGDQATASLVACLYADAEVARSRLSRIKCVNAALRLLRTLRRKPPPAPPSLAEMLAADEAEHV